MKSLEIIISAAVGFSLGFAWYSLLFKNHWKKQSSKGSGSKMNPIGYLFIFLALCAVTYFMDNGCLETHINGGSVGHGVFHGGLYGLSFAIPVIAIHHIFRRKSLLEFLIDAGYVLITFGSIGGMLAQLTLMVY